MKLKFFKFFIFLWQLNSIAGHPGIVEINAPETWKNREKVTRLPSSTNELTNTADYEIISTTPTSTSSLQTLKINYDDVVFGSNSVYGSHFNDQSNTRLTGGGLLFAVNSQGITSSPQIMSAEPPQPVLLQYLSSEGTPKQSAVQYIQVLRPLMMIPPQPYLKPRPLPTPSDISIDAKPIQQKPLVQSAYKKSKPSTSLIGAHSYSYPVTSPPREISLNMNEYMPAASSRVSTIVNPWFNKLMPSNNFQMTQRA